MSVNDRVVTTSGDVDYGQLAPSKSGQTNFTPGKAIGNPQDMNWPKTHRIPTGTPAFGGEAAGPVEMVRVRVIKLGRNTVSDQTVPTPTILDTRVETRCEEGVNGTNTTQDTALPTRPAEIEKNAGNDQIVGA